MPTRLWSLELEGRRYGSSLLIDKRGRIVVSTTRRVESNVPGGIDHTTNHVVGGATTYSNDHALRCYVIAPDGRIEWTANEVTARCEAPDGRLVSTNDRDDFLLLDRDGRVETRRVDGDWRVIGWDGMDPIFSSPRKAVWVAPHAYSLHDRHLHVSDARGNLLSETAIPREPFDAICRERSDLPGWPDAILFPHRLELTYHPQTQRFIASHGSLFAWIMSLGVDGTVHWVRLASDGCCNGVCPVGDGVIAHASSCGQRLTFFTMDGQVLRAHHIDGLSCVFPNDNASVCVRTQDSVSGFDATGEQRWSIDVPDVSTAIARDGVLYTITGDASVELSAFELT